MNNFLAIIEFCAFYIKYKNPKFTGLTSLAEPMLNILWKNSFYNFVKILLSSLVKNNYKINTFSPGEEE